MVWVACEQQFTSHSSGSWNIWDPGAGKFGVWWECTSTFRHHYLLCLYMVEEEGPLGFPFIRALIPFTDTVTLGIRILTYEFADDTNIPSIAIRWFFFFWWNQPGKVKKKTTKTGFYGDPRTTLNNGIRENMTRSHWNCSCLRVVDTVGKHKWKSRWPLRIQG